MPAAHWSAKARGAPCECEAEGGLLQHISAGTAGSGLLKAGYYSRGI